MPAPTADTGHGGSPRAAPSGKARLDGRCRLAGPWCLAHHLGGRGLWARSCLLAHGVRVPTHDPEPPVTRGSACISPVVLPSGLLPLSLPPAWILPRADPGGASASGTHRPLTATTATPPLAPHSGAASEPRDAPRPAKRAKQGLEPLGGNCGQAWTTKSPTPDMLTTWALDGSRVKAPASRVPSASLSPLPLEPQPFVRLPARPWPGHSLGP